MSYLELEIDGLAGLDIVDKEALLISCSHLQSHLKTHVMMSSVL